jgi:hypothetical protein
LQNPGSIPAGKVSVQAAAAEKSSWRKAPGEKLLEKSSWRKAPGEKLLK